MRQKLGPNGEGKLLLKNLVAKKFGTEHAFRKKWGFGIPFSFMSQSKIVMALAEQCAMGLAKDGLASRDPTVFQRAVGGDGYADRTAWILLSTGMWYDIYFRGGEIVSQHSDLPARI